MKKNKKKSEIPSLFFLTAAAMLQGVAMACFLFPHGIASGGAAGVAILFEVWFGWEHSWSLWGLNAFFLILAVRWIGYQSALKTILTVTVTSVTVGIISSFQFEVLFPTYLSGLFGAIIFGLGVGILFRHGASSGGFAIIAHILYKVTGILPGKSMFWMNISIFAIIAIIVDWKLFLFALGTQWISSKVINQVILYKRNSHQTDTSYSI